MKPYFVVLGLGKTGLSLLRWLHPRAAAQGGAMVVCDSRQNPPELSVLRREFPDVEVRLGAFDADFLCAAGNVYVSPGISLKESALQELRQRKGKFLRGDIDIFSDAVNAPVVAITGSNGKSTVTTLVGEMAKKAGLRVAVGGNLGTPALDLLANDVELYVLELSSFQLETCYQLDAEVACCLNLSEDHMDRYENLDEYRAAKLRIFNGANYQVVNTAFADLRSADELPTWTFGEYQQDYSEYQEDDGRPRHFGKIFRRGVSYLSYADAFLLPVSTLKIRGTHNQDNALAALAIGHAAGLPMAAMLDALREFAGLPHRCQWLRERGGVNWYNDSKATNVGAARAAIEGLGQDTCGKLILIAGGDGKGADFSPLFGPVARYCAAVILLGRDADKLAAVLSGKRDSVPIYRVDSLEQAVSLAAQLAEKGDAVLLSPACASLDMFNNFEQRGDVFAKAVEALA